MTGSTSSNAIDWSTLGAPARPPRAEDMEATNSPNKKRTPTNEIYDERIC